MTKNAYKQKGLQINLMMECEKDELSQAQIAAYEKKQKGFAAACSLQKVFMNNGDVLHENDSMVLIYLKNDISSSQHLEIIPDKDIYLTCSGKTKINSAINKNCFNEYNSSNSTLSKASKVKNNILNSSALPFASSRSSSISSGGTSMVQSNKTIVKNNFTLVPSFVFKDENNMSCKRNIFPSLQVVARPSLWMKHISQRMMNEEQLRLDEEVNSILSSNPSELTEWMLKHNLIQTENFCSIHGSSKENKAKKNLCVLSKTKIPQTCSYVWVSSCCAENYTPIFKKSIFEGAPHPPNILLKLLYYWSCQTDVKNVIQRVKISSIFLRKFYFNLRAVCTAAVHEEYKGLLGGKNKMVEVGVISLGTVLPEVKTKNMKVWILGAMESETKFLRLRAIDPVHNFQQNPTQFVRVLEPLLRYVDKDSIILSDLTLDKRVLVSMGYNNVFQTPIQLRNSKIVYSNDNLMEYLKICIPRMFQSTLSLLSRPMIQQFLDELAWRERWGETSLRAFHSILNHIEKQTKIDLDYPIQVYLSNISSYPFMNWEYSKWKVNVLKMKRCNAKTKDKIFENFNTKLNAPDNLLSTPKISSELSTSHKFAVTANGKMIPPDLKKLENYYYGQLEGDKNLLELERKCNLQMKCTLCTTIINTNTNMLKHIVTHALCTYGKYDMKLYKWCKYCLKEFKSDENLNKHIKETHFKIEKQNFTCLICEVDFKNRTKLILHMHSFHNELEMPYECSVCKFRSSEHRLVIDHFYEMHNYSEKVQCPLCLKVVAFEDDGRKITQNIYFFLNHLKKHMCKKLAKHCKRCVLTFVNKGVLDYHQRTHHKSCKDIPNVKRHDGVNTIWMPLPLTSPVNENDKVRKAPQKLNKVYTCDDFSLKIKGEQIANSTCCECEGYILENGHFPGNLSCKRCCFKTCCEKSMVEHAIKFHDSSSIVNHSVKREVILNKPMGCICGFYNVSGDKLANHVVKCKKEHAYVLANITDLRELNTELAGTSVIAENKNKKPTEEENGKKNVLENKEEKQNKNQELHEYKISGQKESTELKANDSSKLLLTDSDAANMIQTRIKIEITESDCFKEYINDDYDLPKKKSKLFKKEL